MDLPQGTLDLLILKAIALERQHGWAISERIEQISNSALKVNQGSLYPALHRLERDRLENQQVQRPLRQVHGLSPFTSTRA